MTVFFPRTGARRIVHCRVFSRARAILPPSLSSINRSMCVSFDCPWARSQGIYLTLSNCKGHYKEGREGKMCQGAPYTIHLLLYGSVLRSISHDSRQRKRHITLVYPGTHLTRQTCRESSINFSFIFKFVRCP